MEAVDTFMAAAAFLFMGLLLFRLMRLIFFGIVIGFLDLVIFVMKSLRSVLSIGDPSARSTS
jgi:hypothetical protein